MFEVAWIRHTHTPSIDIPIISRSKVEVGVCVCVRLDLYLQQAVRGGTYVHETRSFPGDKEG